MGTQQQWKEKVQHFFNCCQDELKKTTTIGKKMISASKTNTCLHDSYKELGRLVFKALEKEELQWDHPQLPRLMQVIRECKDGLKNIEEDVNRLKSKE